MTSQHYTRVRATASDTKDPKKRGFDLVLTALKQELGRDFDLYQEALWGAIQAQTWGGDASPW